LPEEPEEEYEYSASEEYGEYIWAVYGALLMAAVVMFCCCLFYAVSKCREMKKDYDKKKEEEAK